MAQAPLKARNISPLLQKARNFLLGRKHVPERAALRYTPLVAARTQPDPILPDGEAHKMSKNHYVLRDGRREAAPPVVVVDGSSPKTKLLPAEGSKDANAAGGAGIKSPGSIYRWD
ncbi:NADH dehydrogenase [ubiquinone] 1 alpha subcomplex subunit 7 [Folsomia candida]|uniref:NADH dehydrogenase [ubiquinone] 1 alpha subcomplex subunit 7 n=1 Tax=Folsomia candida TaxID=158441 RepID=UPI000B8F0CE2|nr:NADH dehydrogenase [ubiquinone] 1 alpha subcomplex subunit 7 [Folsomia candida]